MNGEVSKVNKKFIYHLARAKCTPSAAATVQVSHALPAVRFSYLPRCRGVSLQDGAAAGKGLERQKVQLLNVKLLVHHVTGRL